MRLFFQTKKSKVTRVEKLKLIEDVRRLLMLSADIWPGQTVQHKGQTVHLQMEQTHEFQKCSNFDFNTLSNHQVDGIYAGLMKLKKELNTWKPKTK